jgi:hypothetical protein
LEEFGFTKLEKHDYGWYSFNENKTPDEVYKNLSDKYDVIFSIDNQEQFQTEYSVWVKPIYNELEMEV